MSKTCRFLSGGRCPFGCCGGRHHLIAVAGHHIQETHPTPDEVQFPPRPRERYVETAGVLQFLQAHQHQCTITPRIEADWLRQLLAYALLDWEDVYAIRHVGFW
ncbi:MAG: hypothetical protein H0X24_15810, partial [Ktedonobacterales bacterium]|nr:hypothetical protein [Ktedonobacterales bacterium]